MKTLFIMLAFVASIALVSVAATTTPTENIKFPVVELGNCKDTKDCHAYCEKPENILKCVDFGNKNGMISAEDAAKAYKFSDVLKGGGPGKCNNQITCKQYCEETSHINECLTFAEKHELIPLAQLKEAKTVAKALQDTGKLPGGCKDKEECEKYCSMGANWSECLEFGKKFGLISKDALIQIKEGLSKMPPEMKSCIIEKVGADAVNKIESGQDVIISPEIGNAIQNCATSFSGAIQQKMEEGLKQAPPEVQGCVKSLISSVTEKVKSGGFKGIGDIIPVILQNCLPKGTKIPSIPSGGGINMEGLKKIEEFYGKSLSPKDLEALKKAQEQLKGIIPQGNEIPSGGKSLNLEDAKKAQEEMEKKLQEEYKNMTPEELEWIKKSQEQQENIAPPEIPGGGSGMGM